MKKWHCGFFWFVIALSAFMPETLPAEPISGNDSSIEPILPASVLEAWVDDSWAGLNNGQAVSLPTGATGYIGYNAFARVQEGINAVLSNGTLHIEAGNYVEQLVINASIHILGEGEPIIHPPAGPLASYSLPEATTRLEPVVIAFGGVNDGSGNISGSGTIAVTISGLTIDGNNAGTSLRYGAFLLRNCLSSSISHNVIRNMLFSSGNPETYGILIYGNSNVTVDSNSINSFSRNGITANGDDGPLTDPTAIIIHNTIVGRGPLPIGQWAQNGIQIGYGASGSINGNEVSSMYCTDPNWSASGIVIVYPAAGVSMAGNNVHDTQGALNAYYCDNLVVNGNNIFDQNDYLFVWGGTNTTISGNTFTNNSQGLYLADAVTADISGNAFVNNDYAIIADGSCSDLNFSGNTINSSLSVAAYIAPYGASPVGVSFSGNDISGNAFGIYNITSNMVDATGNWWGDATGPNSSTTMSGLINPVRPALSPITDREDFKRLQKLAPPARTMTGIPIQNPGLNPIILGTGDAVSSLVDYSPWWQSNYMGDTHVSPWNWRMDITNASTIQEAVDLASAYDRIDINPGIYEGQVEISKEGLILAGSGISDDPGLSTIIRSPSTLAYHFTTGSNNNFPIVGFHDISGSTLQNCRIDGAGRGNSNYRFVGAGFWNSGGTIADCYMTGIQDTPFSGAQHGVGIYAYNNTGGPYVVNITGTEIADAQKTGIALSGNGLTVNVTDCTVSGHGPTTITAQNGIQISYGAVGTVTDCAVSGIVYTGASWGASSMLFYQASAVDVSGGTISNGQACVVYQETNGSVDGIAINPAVTSAEEGISIREYGYSVRMNQNERSARLIAPLAEDYKPENELALNTSTTVSISNSTVTGNGDVGSYGIAAWALGGPDDDITVTIANSQIENWEDGIVSYDDGGGSDLSVSAFHNSILSNSDAGFWTNAATAQNATGNWWGSYCGPYQENTNPHGGGNAVSDNITYAPWCNETFSKCDFSNSPGPSVVWVDDDYTQAGYNDGHYWCYDAFDNISSAISSVSAEGTVNVLSGTYSTQIVIDKSLNLIGNGNPIIQCPAGPLTSYKVAESSARIEPIIFAYGGTNDGLGNISGAQTIEVAITGFNIDGLNSGTALRYGAILLRNCLSSTISYNNINHMLFSSGNPETFGISIYGNSNVAVDHNTVNDFSRTGIVANGDGGALPDPTATITYNTVVGEGPLPSPNWAQNGIQLGYGASGSIEDNEISQIWYTGPSWSASGLILYMPSSGIVLRGNSVHDCQGGLNAYYADNLAIENNNVFSNNDYCFILGGDEVSVTGNTFSDNYQGLYISDATNLGASGNSYINNIYGIIVDGMCDNLNFSENTFANNDEIGIVVQPYETWSPTDVKFNGNDISGNGFGLYNGTADMVHASGNWWGDIGGPEVTTSANILSAIGRPLAISIGDDDKRLSESPNRQAPEMVSQPRLQKSNSNEMPLSNGGQINAPKILTFGNGVTQLVDYSPWWGGNYIGDSHSSTWSWFLDSSNLSSIQEAVAQAANYDSVNVLPDTYSGNGNKDIDFGGKNIRLYSTAGPESTIIDCGGTGRALYFHNGEDNSSKIYGFTIKNGNVTGSGGAILCENMSAPLISHCLIINNRAHGDGGAIHCNNSNIQLIQNTITENFAAHGGGLSIINSNPVVLNTILWADSSANEIYLNTGNPNITYSDIQGGFTGTGNINCDPLFCPEGNYHISDLSCCLNAGSGGVNIGVFETDCIGNFRIIATASPHGIINPSGIISVPRNGSQAFSITPNEHSHITDVLIDGVSHGPITAYTFSGISFNHTIEVMFGLDTLIITATAGEHGSISPSGNVAVDYGSDAAFTITPYIGYRIIDVLVDGVSIGPVTTHAFHNVTEPHCITATFEMNAFIITAAAGEHGTINPSGDVVVPYGTDITFEITPDLGYHIEQLLVDGEPIGSIASLAFTFRNVTANHTISATFSVDIYTITASAGSNGSISPLGVVPIVYGNDTTFTITPEPGYRVADVRVDNIPVGRVTTYTFDFVNANHTIYATFNTGNEAPVITSVPIVSVSIFQLYTYNVEATGIPAPTYRLTLYPFGMTIDSISGIISWTPANNGTFDVRVEAVNEAGFDSQEFSIRVNGCDYVAGDINNSRIFNGLDVTYGVAFFKGGSLPPYICQCTFENSWFVAGDVNASCSFNGLDITFMVSYFKGGPQINPCPYCPPLTTGITKDDGSIDGDRNPR